MRAAPIQFAVFLALKGIILVGGGALAAVGFGVYRRTGNATFRRAAVGFAMVTLGATVDAVYGIYEVLFRRQYALTGVELLAVNTVESLLIAGGLGLLFYSIASLREE